MFRLSSIRGNDEFGVGSADWLCWLSIPGKGWDAPAAQKLHFLVILLYWKWSVWSGHRRPIVMIIFTREGVRGASGSEIVFPSNTSVLEMISLVSTTDRSARLSIANGQFGMIGNPKRLHRRWAEFQLSYLKAEMSRLHIRWAEFWLAYLIAEMSRSKT